MHRHYFFFLGFIFISFSQICNGQTSSEIDLLKEKLSVSNEDTSKVNILIELASETVQIDAAISQQYAKQALKLSQQLNYIKGLAWSSYWLSVVFKDNEFDFSEKLALQSLSYADTIKDSILIANNYNTLGNLKNKMLQNEEALVFYNKSLGIYLRHKLDSAAAGIYNNLGIIHSYTSADSLTFYYYQKAVEINKRTKNHLWLAANYTNLSSFLIETGKFDESFEYMQKSMTIIKEHHYYRSYSTNYNVLSAYYYAIHDYNMSVEFAKKALESSIEHANRLDENIALLNLSDSYFELSDFKQAYNYMNQAYIVNDYINDNSRLKEIDLLELRYKYEEEAKQQELEKVLLEIKYYKQERNNLIILFCAGLLIITFLLIYLLQRNRIKRKTLEQKNTLLEKEQLKRDLDYKKKELTTNVMYLLKKNEFISFISKKLESTNSNDQNSTAIKRIVSELEKNATETNWEEFEKRFLEVHVDFYNYLSKKFPDLSHNDLRLCAFLRLNMTNKEIMEITKQSMDSLKCARYRLRKKLSLEKDNLITFLTQI